MKVRCRKKLLKRLPCLFCIVFIICKHRHKQQQTIACDLLFRWVMKFDHGDNSYWERINKLFHYGEGRLTIKNEVHDCIKK